MLFDLSRSFAQLSDPRFKRVMWRALFWSVLLFAFVVAVAVTGLAHVTFFEETWLDDAVRLVSGAGSVVLAFILFPGIISAVIGMFLDEVAEAVEARHYNDLPAARPSKLSEQLASGARLLAWTVVLNIAALPIYLFVPGLNLFVYYGLNGYLLGREYFEQVALRRMDLDAARRLRRQRIVNVWLGGAAIAAILSIPVVGWFMPVVATAFMVHLVERLRSNSA
jgi:uncharacterized protein involved in cysteine biosynthesis